MNKNSIFNNCEENLVTSILVFDVCRTRVLGELEIFQQVLNEDS